MGIHSLFVRIPSRSLFRTSLVLFCAFAFCLSLLPDANAQRRGWGGGWGGGYRPSTPSYRPPPVYRPAPTPRTLPQRQVTPRPTTPRPGSSPTVRTAPTIKPNTPVAGVKGYKGQVTAKGLPVIQYKGKNWQIPQKGISSLKTSSSVYALNSRWSPQQQKAARNKIAALAAGTVVAAVGKGTLASSSIVPGGGLQAHEAAGGHTIEKHVGKTKEQLLARFQTDPHIPASSSFTNRATAEEAVTKAISANDTKIQQWLAGTGRRLTINNDARKKIGIYLRKGESKAVKVQHTFAVLVKDPQMPTGYRIQTAYPVQEGQTDE